MRTRFIAIAFSSAALALPLVNAAPAASEDKLLSEVVDFSGTILFLGAQVPGLVVGAVRGNETALATFGETATGSGKTPDGNTIMRIG